MLETNSIDTIKPHGQALLRLATAAWTSHCAFKISLAPQPIIWSTSGHSGCGKKYSSTKTDHHFHFFPCDVSGGDCSVSTNTKDFCTSFQKDPLMSLNHVNEATGDWCYINQRTHPSMNLHRALHLPNNRFSNTLQLHPIFILNYFTLTWSPLSCKVATKDLCTCC